MDMLIAAWQNYLDQPDSWQGRIKDVTPRKTGCGLVYELGNPLDRPDEDLAIVDMRLLAYTEPHCHNISSEIYFVLQGEGYVVVGADQHLIQQKSVVVVPVRLGHFIIPHHDLVEAVVNTPPFSPDDYIPLDQSDQTVHFDKNLFTTLVTERKKIWNGQNFLLS